MRRKSNLDHFCKDFCLFYYNAVDLQMQTRQTSCILKKEMSLILKLKIKRMKMMMIWKWEA